MVYASGGGRIAESSKARIRRASLLRNEDYKRLLEQSSVGEIAVLLGKTPYASMLEGISLERMRRAELEFLLDAAILAEGVAFRHYMGPGDRQLLDLWLENFDIELLKNRFRTRLSTGKWEDSDTSALTDQVAGFHLTLVDQEKLSVANTVKDVLAAIKKDSLRAALTEAIPPGRENVDMSAQDPIFQKTAFAMGMILDRYYFDSLYTVSETLGGNEGRMMRMLVGARVDLMNLYWIYRGRRFFGMSPEEALTLIMKVRHRVDFEILTRVAFADPATYPVVLKDTPYGEIFNVENEEPSLREVRIESRIYGVLFTLVNRVFMSGSSGFQNVAAYLMLKEFEVRDLIAVIEAVRYGFDKSRISAILIRSLEDDESQSTNTKSGG